MKISKIILVIVIMIGLDLICYGQDYDPQVTNLTFGKSLIMVNEKTTLSGRFLLQRNTVAAQPQVQVSCGLKLSFGTPTNLNSYRATSTPPTGSGAQYFTWTYNTSTSSWSGVQSLPMSDGEGGIITIEVEGVSQPAFAAPGSLNYSDGFDGCISGNTGTNDAASSAVTVFGVLPINLLSFTAKKVNNEEVMLNWETATEENFKGFDVEASIDGSKFAKIGYVEGRGSDSKYVMMDRNPFQGVNYYRLKSVDVDGSFVYSDIKAVEITERSRRELTVYPNPFNGGFTLSGLKPGSEIKIHDIKGSVVYTNKTDDSVFRVNVPSLVGGVYNVSVTNSGETISKRLIKID